MTKDELESFRNELLGLKRYMSSKLVLIVNSKLSQRNPRWLTILADIHNLQSTLTHILKHLEYIEAEQGSK
jgi:hypothetical protein